MISTTLAQRARAVIAREIAIARQTIASLPALRGWAWDRAHERSTWTGVAFLAGAAGKHEWADWFNANADAIVFALTIVGSALVAANTSKGKTT